MLPLLFACLCEGQGPRLDVPVVVVAGQPVVVRAAPDPVPDMRLQLLDAEGKALGTHAADAGGAATLTIAEPGDYTLKWTDPLGVEVLAPFHVVAPRPRWFSAWWVVPLGLALAWRSLRYGMRASSR